jgi:hypothetical protein
MKNTIQFPGKYFCYYSIITYFVNNIADSLFGFLWVATGFELHWILSINVFPLVTVYQ